MEDFWRLEESFYTGIFSFVLERPEPWTEHIVTTMTFLNPPQPILLSGLDVNHCFYMVVSVPPLSPHEHFPHKLPFTFWKALEHSFSWCPLLQAFIISHPISQFSYAQGGDWTIMQVMLLLSKTSISVYWKPRKPWPEALGAQSPPWMIFTIWESISISGPKQCTVWYLEEQWKEQCA